MSNKIIMPDQCWSPAM